MNVKTPRVKLKTLGRWGSGGTPLATRPEYYNGEIPWLIIEDLNDGIVKKSKRTITQLGLQNSSAKIVPVGTLLIAMYGSIGKLGITSFPCATNQAIAFCVCTQQVLPRFLFYQLLSRRNELISAGRGGTQRNINQEFLRELEVKLPEMEKQRKIAAMLDQADQLRRIRSYSLDLVDDFLAGAFRRWFLDEDKNWPVYSVEALAAGSNAIRTGPFGSQLLHSEFTASGVAVLGIDNVVHNHFEWAQRRFISLPKYEKLRRYTVHSGDVLITIMGTCGRCAIVPDNIPIAINTKHLCCITLDRRRCLPVYLQMAFLHHPAVQHAVGVARQGAIMDGLNMDIIKNLHIPVPPLPLQESFAAFVAYHEHLRVCQREALRQVDNLFQALLYRAFASV